MTTPTPYKKPTRRPAQPVASKSIRATVSSWSGRTLRVQHDHDLLSILQVLQPHEADLASHCSGAPRLYASVTAELTKRGLLPC